MKLETSEKKIDAIIIGAGRSGTTTLYEYLNQHPEVTFSDIKEIHYFSVLDLYKRGAEYFHSFFKGKFKTQVTADTYLLADSDAPKRVFDYNPQIKVIIILRNQVDRAFSGFNYAKNFGYLSEETTFKEATLNEDTALNDNDIIKTNNLCNMYQSLYGKHITCWQESIPSQNFLILKTSDLKEKPQNVLKQLSLFLNISDFELQEKQIKTNVAAKAKSKKLQQILLNRDLPIRKVLRNFLPAKAKQAIIKSGVIKKASSMNKTKSKLANITDDERKFADDYFEEDKKLLFKLTGIEL